jgi:hypothetical protein
LSPCTRIRGRFREPQVPQGLKRLRKKADFQQRSSEGQVAGLKTGCGKRHNLRIEPPRLLQGLKPDVDLIGFIGTTEVVPMLQNLRELTTMSFSAACKTPVFPVFFGTTEVVPCYKAT